MEAESLAKASLKNRDSRKLKPKVSILKFQAKSQKLKFHFKAFHPWKEHAKINTAEISSAQTHFSIFDEFLKFMQILVKNGRKPKCYQIDLES